MEEFIGLAPSFIECLGVFLSYADRVLTAGQWRQFVFESLVENRKEPGQSFEHCFAHILLVEIVTPANG